MAALANVAVHGSQFPEQVWAELRNSLRLRQINHKFHYDSYRQTQKWLELHAACSPSRTDQDCAQCFENAFAAAAGKIGGAAIHVIGLGCGGGQKDTRLLRLLRKDQRQLDYTPVDVSLPMVLTAREAASEVVAEPRGLVCDLALAEDLAEYFNRETPEAAARVMTFFGMMPNFEPGRILPRLAGLLRERDLLLLSANLAPSADYEAGVVRVLPQYANNLVEDWLRIFLLDLGVEQTDGTIEWVIEPCPSGSGLLRITARFGFQRGRSVTIAGERFEFKAEEKIRLFFSYRYTPERVLRQLEEHGLTAREQWIADSGEEGVFLCGRKC
jgi:uncharacterized SAM-dependent methyltransferase